MRVQSDAQSQRPRDTESPVPPTPAKAETTAGSAAHPRASAPAASRHIVADTSAHPNPDDEQGSAATHRSSQRDGVDRGTSGAPASLLNWAKNEWSTVASAAHGLASAPGIVSHAWLDAAKKNTELGASIRDTVDHWSERSATGRQTLIDGLENNGAKVSRTVAAVANELSQANRLPLDVEISVSQAAKSMPAGARHAMEDLAQHPSAQLAKLAPPVQDHALHAARDLENVARMQTAKASHWLPSASRGIATKIEHAVPVPILKEIPVAGLLIAGAATVYDVRSGVSPAAATTANIASTIAGQAAGMATESVLTAATGLAIGDEAALAAGAVVASGPVGWIVAGGVVAGAAVGYGVYKAIESKPGQAFVDGLAHADLRTLARQMSDAEAQAANGIGGR